MPIEISDSKSAAESSERFYAAVRKAFRDLAGLFQEQRFKVLASEWKQDTKFLSNTTTKSMHPAYQKIIGMGEVAVPLILNDLAANGPDDWFWALHVITDANPITDDIAGNMALMTEAWLKWGSETGYLTDYCRPTRRSFQA